MNAVLICPADRLQVGELARRSPLVTVPVLGRSTLELWLEALAARGVARVAVLAADRPKRVRDQVGDGRRWGLKVEVVPTPHELSLAEARAKQLFGADAAAEHIVIDHLPGQPDLPLFESYAGWFAAQRAWLPRAVTDGRIGVRELIPGVWVGLRAQVSPGARLEAPCWIGDYARIEADAQIGPGAIVGDRAVIETGARVLESVIGPDTFVGRFVSVERSLAQGGLLVNWQTQSTLHVPDPFLLADLAARSSRPRATSLLSRAAATVAMVATAPVAAGVIALSLLRGESPWQLRLGLRSERGMQRIATETFGYYELTGARNWLRRWPQFWCVARGEMTWVGNRPLRPTQALTLANEFERLWLAAPVGLISLADAHGCPDGISDEAVAHASFYAVHASLKLDAAILARAALRAALVWPIPRGRRREAPVPLQNLATRQEL